MPSPKPKRIRKIEYDRIDRVPAGAQPGAKIPLVKAREKRVRIDKLVDPKSLDAQIQRIRDEFRENYSDSYGCCSPCSGWVYCDAVYGDPDVVVAVDSKGHYWQFPYTVSDSEITFGTPEAVTPNVEWAALSTDDAAPIPLVKALWSASVAERVQRITKEQTMPAPKPDLSALDETTRAAVEAALTENETLLADKATFDAAVAATPAPELAVVDDDEVEDLETVAGLQKALKATRSPEMKRILKATLTRLEKAEAENTSLREDTVKLQKAERVRLFKERAKVVPNMAAHAVTEVETDGITALAKMLEQIDEKAGPEVAEAVEVLLTKAQTQLAEAVKPLLKSVGRVGTDAPGGAVVIGSLDDPDVPIAEKVAELKKSMPELSDAQATARVLRESPHLYAEAIESAR